MADSFHFVGGLGTKADASDTNGGGGLHSIISASQGDRPTNAEQLSYMAADGGPVDAVTGATYTIPLNSRITKVNEFTNSQVGHYAYVQSTTGGSATRILITARDDDWIEFGGTIGWGSPHTDVVANVGGTYATLAEAIDKVPDAINGDLVHVLTNQNETPAAATDNINQLTGDVTDGSVVIIEGYGTVPGDNEIVTMDGQGTLADFGFDIDNIDNVIWMNLRAFDTTQAAGTNGWRIGVTVGVTNCMFINCIADDCRVGFVSLNHDNTLFVNCQAVNNLLQGVLEKSDACWENLLSYNNEIGIEVESGNSVILRNGTIDGNDVEGVLVETVAGTLLRCINTISSNNGSENFKGEVGTLTLDHCNSYNGGGADVATDIGNNLAVGPQYQDAANGDYRLKLDSPCINAGLDTPNDGVTTMGAHQFRQLEPIGAFDRGWR